MKNCLQCGTSAEDWEPTCTMCGRKYAFQGMTEEVAGLTAPVRDTPPDGANLAANGAKLFWASIALALLAALLIARGLASYSGDGAIAFGVLVGSVATILFPVSGVFWATGKVVHAIAYYSHAKD